MGIFSNLFKKSLREKCEEAWERIIIMKIKGKDVGFFYDNWYRNNQNTLLDNTKITMENDLLSFSGIPPAFLNHRKNSAQNVKYTRGYIAWDPLTGPA